MLGSVGACHCVTNDLNHGKLKRKSFTEQWNTKVPYFLWPLWTTTYVRGLAYLISEMGLSKFDSAKHWKGSLLARKHVETDTKYSQKCVIVYHGRHSLRYIFCLKLSTYFLISKTNLQILWTICWINQGCKLFFLEEVSILSKAPIVTIEKITSIWPLLSFICFLAFNSNLTIRLGDLDKEKGVLPK